MVTQNVEICILYYGRITQCRKLRTIQLYYNGTVHMDFCCCVCPELCHSILYIIIVYTHCMNWYTNLHIVPHHPDFPLYGGGATYPHIPPSPHQESNAPPPHQEGSFGTAQTRALGTQNRMNGSPPYRLIIFPPVKGTVPSALYEKSFITQLKRLYHQLCMSNHLSPS